jgi:capsid protein
MNILGIEINRAKKQEVIIEEPKSEFPFGNGAYYGQPYTVINKVWDGEKTLGELGTPIRNIPDYQLLRIRAYDAYAKADVVKIICSKFFYWVIGSGLKLQAEPNRTVLESEGISFDYAKFQKLVEARFQIYASSKQGDYLKQKSLHELALDFFQGKFLGGDVLCIMRFDNNGPNVQFVSGEHVQSPTLDNNFLTEAEARGNRIEHGIELDKKGAHIAYYICVVSSENPLGEVERIEAKGEYTGKTMAWMICGNKISPDHVRAVPAISQALEKISKLDRYTEASVGKAEQAAKIANFIEHDKNSTGENVYDQVLAAKRREPISTSTDTMALADGLANRITETTSNQTFNMPIGATMKSFSTNIESDFNQFHTAIFNIISAGLDVPPEVAMQMYNSNYSASIAAINGCGYVVDIHREKFANDFYIPFYKAWLEFEILKNKIEAPEFVNGIVTDNFMVTESYSQCRFTGKNMPHIDPLKEIKAVREALGIDGADPLISREQADEMLGYGNWYDNFMKNQEEKKIIPTPQVIVDNSSNQ